MFLTVYYYHFVVPSLPMGLYVSIHVNLNIVTLSATLHDDSFSLSDYMLNEVLMYICAH